jgi:hypothetical protein
MPKKKPPALIWLAPLGRTLYENLNPFWAFCESGRGPVAKVALLHDEEMDREARDAATGFAAVGEAFLSAAPAVWPLPFNDEDVRAFRKKAEAVFAEAAAENRKIVVDISPTTLNYVPVLLVEMVRAHRKAVAAVNYMQYDEHRMRRTPHALIPRGGLIFNDLLPELTGERRAAP